MACVIKHVFARNFVAKKIHFNMLSAVETKNLTDTASGNSVCWFIKYVTVVW